MVDALTDDAATNSSQLGPLSGYRFLALVTGEQSIYRGVCEGREPLLVIVPREGRSSRRFLEQEFALREELSSSWAARPIAITSYEGRMALVIEDRGGTFLSELIGQLDIRTFLRVGISIAVAVQNMHERGIIHKDLKPANILVDVAGGDNAWLTGFGIASRLLREHQVPEPPAVISGSLAYMAPEQTGRMNRSIDLRSDLYALGVTFYEVLTGALPFTASDPIDLIHSHIARQPVPLSSIENGIPRQLSTIVMKLLAKTAEERYQTAAGLESDLRLCLSAWEADGCIDPFPVGRQDASNRLMIPEKLYGRESEIAKLLSAFDNVAKNGEAALVLVSGYSGIGKSSVVNELHKVIVLPRGIFVSGKFDQRVRDIPYATLSQAFQGLVRQILSSGDDDIRRWREAILHAVGGHGILLTELIPDLALLVGPQPPISMISPSEAQLRLQTVFQRFVSVFARSEHPLIIFVDDLQWLDPATLVLVEHLMTSPDTRHLLLIGAYRDNEVEPTHPLMAMIEAIRKSGVRIDKLVLTPISVEHINRLLNETLRRPQIGSVQNGQLEVRPLAELVHGKTGGNPFFVVQFLTNLAEEGLLKFDAPSQSWLWDISGIEGKAFTDNLVDLMVRRLRRLTPASQGALKMLACLGSHTDLATLSAAHIGPEDMMHAGLRAAAQAGVIYSRSGQYRFLHDRIQEAAYALIPAESLAEFHLQIARRLLSKLNQKRSAEKIFDIVNHLNRGAPLLNEWAEKEEVARLNLQAGRKAKASLAYASACSYFSAGLAVLGAVSWQKCYELTWTLCFELAECGLLCSDFDETDRHIEEMLTNGQQLIERAEAHRMKVVLLNMQGRNEEAIQTAFNCLQMLGLDLPQQPSVMDVEMEYKALREDLGERSIENLIDLPLMMNVELNVATNVLERLGLAAYFHNPLLSHLIACRSARLGIEHGNNEYVTLAFSGVGLFIGPILGCYEEGERFCRLAVDCSKRHGFPVEVGANVTLQMAAIWTKPLEAAVNCLDKAVKTAEATGEVIYGCIAREHQLTDFLARGDPLDRVWQASSSALAFVERAKFRQCVDIIRSTRVYISALRGTSIERRGADRSIVEEVTVGSEVPVAICFERILQIQKNFLFGNPVQSLECAKDVTPLFWSARPHIQWVDYCLYHSLALASVHSSASLEEQSEFRLIISEHLASLKPLITLCPETFLHKYSLMAAEAARIDGNDIEAMRFYEEAILGSAEHNFVQDQAISYEMAFHFYLSHGFEKFAYVYLHEARDCYLRWGAYAKVEQLDRAYPRQSRLSGQPLATTIETPSGQLDVAAVVRMSQAVASEIVLDKLIETLMVVAMEHAGADRGVLILVRDQKMSIAAEARSDVNAIGVSLFDHAEEPSEYPALVLEQVRRAQDAVILDDARSSETFSFDPYIRRRQVRSLMCLPLVKQRDLIGILYLENNLASHAFTPARTEVLKLLSSQAAISLENAHLYSDLLKENRDRRRAEDALRASEAALSEAQQISHTGSWRWTVGADNGSVSAECFRIYGFDPATAQPSYSLLMGRLHPEDGAMYQQLQEEAVEKRKRFEHEYRIVLPDGTIRHAQIVGEPVVSETGVFEFVGTVMDITERKRAEEAVRNAQAELARVARLTTMGELVASIAHEITQPLAAITASGRAGLNWLNREPPDLDGARNAIARMDRDARRAGDVIRSLRALVMKSDPHLVQLDVNGVIQEVLLLMRSELERRDIRLRTDLRASGSDVSGDRVQLQQVLLNLIMNGIEGMSSTEQPRVISITSQRDEMNVTVAVSDTGTGIEAEAAARVFDPFFTTKTGGMGMGLSICRSIIEGHNGRLWVQPNVPRGATFSFALPLKQSV